MIFVTLGTQKFQLNRLLKKIDEYIENGIITEEVFAQVGNSDYVPKHYEYSKFLDKNEFDKIVAKADVVVTHSGVGTIITSINLNKPVVVYPRLAKYKEHVDDHQLEIAKAFSKKRYVLMCDEEDELISVINEAKKFKFEKYVSQRDNIIKTINIFLNAN